MKAHFGKEYTSIQRDLINRLAEIEESDEEICSRCGGEDCVCCEIYHDRNKWVSPTEMFDQYDFDNRIF